MSPAGPWLLSRRITRWCVLVGTGFVALLAMVGIVLVHIETANELDALVSEELGETIRPFAESGRTPQDFAAIAVALQESHPFNAMAWRVWKRADGSQWGSFGDAQLLALLPAKSSEQPSTGSFMLWRTAQLTPELEVGLLLAGGGQVAGERTFALVALSIVALAAGMSFLAGRLLGRRVGRVLGGIAAESRANALEDASAHATDGLPLEMRAVVEAQREALARIRAESDRARLLASGVAHELRTPLQNLLLQAEVALLRERPAGEYQSALSKQILDLQELIRAVDNLVTLCAPPEARRALFGQSFDFATEARLRLGGEQARAAQKGIALELDLPASLPFRGDREGLMLVLRNLVANAIDWSPARGRIEVHLGERAQTLSLAVDDQGRGVPEAERQRVFLPFERGSARADGRLGYGLGLALVRTVVEQHRGTVHIADSPLGGASFRVELPNPREAALAEPRASVAP